MGIHLDWQVESDIGHQAVEEDAQIIAAQKKRIHRWRIALIAALVLLIVAGSIAWYRAKIVRDEKLRVLLATVAAEAEALRIGDKTKFMKLQGSDDAWRDEQREAFDQMQAFGVAIEVTGRILSQQISGHEAEITVEILINDTPSQAIWLYQYTEDGWRHVDTQQEPWEDQTIERYPFTYSYNTAHQPIIDELDTMLREWWAIAGAETPLDEPLEISIRIDPEYAQVRWHVDNPNRLLIPQHLLTAADLTAPDDPLRIELAKRLSNRWTVRFFEENDLRSNNYDLRSEVASWLIDQFGATPPPPYRTSIFTRLSTYFGEDIFHHFMEEWQYTDEGMIALQRAMFPDSPLSPEEANFEHFLNTYAALQNDQNLQLGLGALDVLFIARPDNPAESLLMADFFLAGAQPGSFKVEKLEVFQEVLWVRATFDYNSNWYNKENPPSIYTRSAFLPFRRADGAWKLTPLYETDWGSPIVEQGDLVTFTYPEIDAALYEGMLPYAESIYLQAAAEFGLNEVTPIEVRVKTDIMYIEDDPNIIAPLVYPHRQQCCFGEYEMNAETVRKTIAQAVYYDVFNFVAGSVQRNLTRQSALESALMQWVYDQHDLNIGYEERSQAPHPDVLVPTTFAEIEAIDNGFRDSESQYRYMLRSIGIESFITVLMETYGDDALLPLVRTVRSTESIEDWLQQSLQLDNLEIFTLEGRWREHFHEQVRQRYGEAAFANQ